MSRPQLHFCHGSRDHVRNYYNFTSGALTKNKYMSLEQTEDTNTTAFTQICQSRV
jgi:hypothetical protein